MSTDERQIRHPGRLVDISLGVTLAAAILAMPNLALLLVYLALDLKGAHWDAIRTTTGCATVTVAVLSLTVWLVRARR